MAKGGIGVTLLRLGLAALLFVALWNPPLPWLSPPEDVIVVLDDSLSMKSQFDRGLWPRIAKRIALFPSGARVGLVRYGVTSAVEAPLEFRGREKLRTVLASRSPPRGAPVSRGATDTQSALAVALRLATTDRTTAIILITDGFDTRGHVGEALRRAKIIGVPVFWFDPERGKVAGDRWVQDIHVPATVVLGEQAPIIVTVGGDSGKSAHLRISVNNRLISDSVLPRRPGGSISHQVRFTPRAPGDYVITATLEGTDDIPENNIRAAVLNVSGPLPVLIVRRKDAAATVGQTLTAGGQTVVEIGPESFPPRADGLRVYSSVILDDIAVGAMSDAAWRALSKAVGEMGVGLVVLGGPHSFAAGAYRHSRLETWLPVLAEARVPEGRAAVQFVVDKSGSMDRDRETGSRFSIAKKSVVETARRLASGDLTGLIWFDVAAHTALPLDVYPDPAAAIERAWTVRPSGGTALTSALRTALDRLSSVTADQRLLVLVTDGQSPAGENLVSLSARIRDEGVDVISLVIGDDDGMAAPLDPLSSLNNGALRHIDQIAELPRIMRREIETRRNPARLGFTAPRQKAPVPYLAPFGWPSFTGYMVTRARPTAQVYLESEEGDPLFATGSFGAGRVAVLPGGLGGWAKAWPKWSHWGKFVKGLVQSIAIRNDNPLLDVRIENEAGQLKFDVDAIEHDGEWSREPFASVSLYGGGRGVREFVLPQIAPGHYAGRVDVDAPGLYRATTRVGEQVVRRGIVYAADHEFRAVSGPTTLAKLEQEGLVTSLPHGDVDAAAGFANAARPSRPLLLVVAIGWFFLLLIHQTTGLHPRRLISGAALWRARIFHRQRNPRS